MQRSITAFDTHVEEEDLIVAGWSDGTVELQFLSASSPIRKRLVGSTSLEVKRICFAPPPTSNNNHRALRILCASGDVAYLFESSPSASFTENTSFTTRQFRGAHKLDVTECAFSFDGKLVVTSGLDNMLLIWDAQTQRQLFELRAANEMCRGMALDPLGRFCAGVLKEYVQLWRLGDGQAVGLSQRLVDSGSIASLTSVAWSPDGKYLAVGTSQGNAFFFDRDKVNAGTGQQFSTGHGEAISHVRFSPVLYGGEEQGKRAVLVALASRNVVSIFSNSQTSALLTAKVKSIIDLAWLASGKTLYCLSAHLPPGPPQAASSLMAEQYTALQVPMPSTYPALSRQRTIQLIEERGVRRTDDHFIETVAQLEAEEAPPPSPPPPPPPLPPPPSSSLPAPPTTHQRESVTKTGKKRIQPALVLPAATASAPAAAAATAPATTTTTTVAATSSSQPPAVAAEEQDCGTCKACLATPKVQRCLNRAPPVKQQVLLDVSLGAEDGTGLDGEEDGWESSDLEVDEADTDVFVLSADSSELLDTSLQVDAEHTLTTQSTPTFAAVLACVRHEPSSSFSSSSNGAQAPPAGKRLWQVPLHSKIVRIATTSSNNKKELVAFATSGNDVYIHDLRSGAALGPALSTSNHIVHLDFAPNSNNTCLLLAATRDGRVFVWDVSNARALLANIQLDPLLVVRGRPFSIYSPTLALCKAKNSSNGAMVRLLVAKCSPVLLLLVDNCCYALLPGEMGPSWTKILDPLRFLGSELLTLRSSNSNTDNSAWEVETLHRSLCLLATATAGATAASQQAKMLFQQEVNLSSTVAHLESHYLAAVALNTCLEEREHWLRLLFEKMGRDFSLFYPRARFWLARVQQQQPSLVKKMLLVLSSANTDYQRLVEEWMERQKDF